MEREYVASAASAGQSDAATLASTEPVLEIRHAKKRFLTPDGREIRAVDDVSISVAPNEFVTLLGPSGCGKTTLLRLIAGFEDLDSGEIRIDGRSMASWPAHQRPVNTVFQKYALFPHLTVARNVAYSLEVARKPKAEIASRVQDMLELVGLGGYGSRQINELSGGQQQRVALARALVARPRILLLDEPLSALDRGLRSKMQHELKALQNELGISFVFVTHDQEEALTMSDRIAVLGQGKIQHIGTPEALYRQPQNLFTARFLGESNLLPATLEERTETTETVTLSDGRTLQFAPGAVPAGARPGQALQLLARPEDISLAQPTEGASLCFRGRVAQQLFIGSHYRLVIDTNSHASFNASAGADIHLAETLKVGTEVTFWIPQGRLHCLIDDEAAS